MKPSVGTVAQASLAGGVPALFLGAHIDALIAGLFAAVLSTIWLPTIDDRIKSFSAIALSTLFAGYGSQILVTAIMARFSEFTAADIDQFRILTALCIGFATPLLTPSAIRFAQRFLNGEGKRHDRD
ncbi:MAG: hypothetical protein FWH15_10180 [Betaproteobacteria bacterium]|nr:hypothetical protein [Betaproteobacteria bacterium]